MKVLIADDDSSSRMRVPRVDATSRNADPREPRGGAAPSLPTHAPGAAS